MSDSTATLVRAFIAGFIGDHEGKLSMHPADNGNWYDPARYRANQPQRRGLGVLVGSKFGVTAYALVRYRLRKGRQIEQAVKVTPADMAGLDLLTAIDIGYELYYVEPGFYRLPWNRVTAAILDKAWGSGPGTAILMVQEMIGIPKAERTPNLGSKTDAMFDSFMATHGEEDAAHRWCDIRIAFDTRLAANDGPNDPDRAFLGGWNNRSRSFLPGTRFWTEWERKAA